MSITEIIISILKVSMVAVPSFIGLLFIFRSEESTENAFNNSYFKRVGVSPKKYSVIFKAVGLIFIFLAIYLTWFLFFDEQNYTYKTNEVKEFWKKIEEDNSSVDLFKTALLSAVILIPARMGSTRFFGKPLVNLGNKKIIERVYEKCLNAKNASNVFILTDSTEIENFAKSINANVLMTSKNCQSGTERIIEVLDKIDSNFFVNVQGDEPFIPSELIDSVIDKHFQTNSNLVTATSKISDQDDLFNPNVVKILRNSSGEAIYFSRSPLPFVRGESSPASWLQKSSYWKHIGIYGYSKSALLSYSSLKQSPLESCEMLEQLRFIDAGFKFSLVETNYKVLGIDTPDDLIKAQKLL